MGAQMRGRQSSRQGASSGAGRRTVQVRVLPTATSEVIDHGPGVAPSDREKKFEPVWRSDRESAGVGLGVPISKRLIERM